MPKQRNDNRILWFYNQEIFHFHSRMIIWNKLLMWGPRLAAFAQNMLHSSKVTLPFQHHPKYFIPTQRKSKHKLHNYKLNCWFKEIQSSNIAQQFILDVFDIKTKKILNRNNREWQNCRQSATTTTLLSNPNCKIQIQFSRPSHHTFQVP